LQTAFGLYFSSDRVFAELNPAGEGSPLQRHVALEWGDTPVDLSGPHVRSGLCQATQDVFLLTVPSVARFLITRESIMVTPVAGASDDAVRLFLFGSAVGALLHLNGILALHASAVRLREGAAALFAGPSTAGKSTIAAALGQRGYALLADDIAALHFDSDGVPWLHPGLARSKLWGGTLEQLGLSRQAGARVREGLDKYAMPQAAWLAPERLTEIYELRPVEQGEVAMEECKGLEKVSLLARQTYRPRFIDAIGANAAHMRRLAQLASTVHTHRLTRSRGRSTIHQIVALLERTWS
jgi:hypothetical protein